jgi:uncharacterized RDD family membrane protein YckC
MSENGGVPAYPGLATRTLAFAVDAAIINAVAWLVAAVVALGLSLLGVPGEVRTVLAAIGAVIALGWTVGYFTFFWSASGQTPGNRVMEISVRNASTGRPIGAGRAVLRVCLLPLSALPLCAGFLLILVDARRRALHDRLAGTVVVNARADVRSRRVVRPVDRRAEDDVAGAHGRPDPHGGGPAHGRGAGTMAAAPASL